MSPRTRDTAAGTLLCLVMREPLDLQRIADAASSVGSRDEWLRLLDLAQERGVLLLLRRAIGGIPSGVPPQSVLDELRHRSNAIIANNLLLVHELSRTLDLLRLNGVSALAWKGPVLATELYASVALREFRDLDLFVRSADVTKAALLLESAGYRQPSPTAHVNMPPHLSRAHELQFTRNDQLVELHWAITKNVHAFPFDFEGLWERQRRVRVESNDLPTTGVEDLFLSLAIHGTSHAWDRAIWICDIARVIQLHPELDLASILSRADREHFGRMIRVTLALVTELQLLTLPGPIIDDVRQDQKALELAHSLAGLLFSGSGTRRAFVQFHLGVRESLRDRARFVANALFHPSHEDWETVPLPVWAAPLYYIIRPLRMMVKYTTQALVPGASR